MPTPQELNHRQVPRMRRILFLCTGNTCRSPLAEVLCRQMLCQALGCSPQELPARGFVVQSAGVAAFPGDPATELAIEVAAEYGANLTDHRSRPVNSELLEQATDVITMTHAHAAVLKYRYPGIGPVPVPLCGDDEDLLDPIGGDLAVYRACAETIRKHLQRFLNEWISAESESHGKRNPGDTDSTGGA